MKDKIAINKRCSDIEHEISRVIKLLLDQTQSIQNLLEINKSLKLDLDLTNDLLNTTVESHMEQQLTLLTLKADVNLLISERDKQREVDDKILHTN